MSFKIFKQNMLRYMQRETIDEYYPIKFPLGDRLKLFFSMKLKCVKYCFTRSFRHLLYSPRMKKLTKLYN